jgi:hypothetical protein
VFVAALAAQPIEFTKRIAAAAMTVTDSFRIDFSQVGLRPPPESLSEFANPSTKTDSI